MPDAMVSQIRRGQVPVTSMPRGCRISILERQNLSLESHPRCWDNDLANGAKLLSEDDVVTTSTTCQSLYKQWTHSIGPACRLRFLTIVRCAELNTWQMHRDRQTGLQ